MGFWTGVRLPPNPCHKEGPACGRMPYDPMSHVIRRGPLVGGCLMTIVVRRRKDMSKYYDRAVELRASAEPHYNCAQSVFLPFAEAAGVAEATAYKISANFGAGMRRASVCGAITGGLMALGLFGVDDTQSIAKYHNKLKEAHEGALDCSELLTICKAKGQEKKPHCDEMVYECVQLVEEILKEQGKL